MANKTQGTIRIIFLIVILLSALGYLNYIKRSTTDIQQNQSMHKSEVTPYNTTDWKTYKNTMYGFEFQYPSTSTIEPDSNNEYIRLQNYNATDDQQGLNPGEYYLEIFISDRKLGNTSSESCETLIINPVEINLGNTTGTKGLGQSGGDAGGKRFALCTKQNEVQFYLQGTQNDEQGALVHTIFDSFKFTK